MRVAILFNPNAGGNSHYTNIGKILGERLKGCKIKTYPGLYGQTYIENAEIVSRVNATGDYLKDLYSIIMEVIKTNPELLVCVGGDGFLAYIADAMIRNNIKIPLLGIAGGTANVGPLINFTAASLMRLDLAKIKLSPVGALEVALNKSIKGYAFNDVIIGNTFLGMLNEQMSNIGVETFIQTGIKKKLAPSTDIVLDYFQIAKNELTLQFNMKKPAQIVISPIEGKNYLGKAITGLLCHATLTKSKAALALLDRVIVSMESENKDNELMSIEQLIFTEEDKLSISGLSRNGHVIIDGNPFIRQAKEAVNIRCIANAVIGVNML
ncbi:MAG: diacylglycerol kinase family protein [Clostridia bacterium]